MLFLHVEQFKLNLTLLFLDMQDFCLELIHFPLDMLLLKQFLVKFLDLISEGFAVVSLEALNN